MFVQPEHQANRNFMSYLNSTRTQIVLGCFLTISVLFRWMPEIDINVSKLFFDQTAGWSNQFVGAVFQKGIGYVLAASLSLLLGIYAYNRLAGKNIYGIDSRKVMFPLLVLIVGAGLIVNIALKDHFGRARPRDIEEFGGSKQFTPAFVISHECGRNCSFSSGDGAGAFLSLSLALALTRRRSALFAACAFGCVVSYLRVATGAHFLSDVVVSFFIMLITTDVLFHYMFPLARVTATMRDPEKITVIGRPALLNSK